ncbi:hypothetical protein GCM10027589_05910 [Actinocorallia lasiicapitis]
MDLGQGRFGARFTAVVGGAAVVLAVATGCGSDAEPEAVRDTPLPAGSTAAGSARPDPGTRYPTPSDLAAELRKAGLGCAKPKPAEIIGGEKVSCKISGEQVNIELYESKAARKQGAEIACEMGKSFGIKPVFVTDGDRWSISPESVPTAKKIQAAVGGQLKTGGAC